MNLQNGSFAVNVRSIDRSRSKSRHGTLLAVVAGIALAEFLEPAAHATGDDDSVGAPSLPGPTDSEDPRYDDLQQQFAELTARLKQSEEERTKSVSRLSIHGYVDFGFFAPIGNRGVGFIEDVGNMQTPQYSQYSWTFLGDILATAVNTRGEFA